MGCLFFTVLNLVLPAALWFTPFYLLLRFGIQPIENAEQRFGWGIGFGIIHLVLAIGVVYYLVYKALRADELSGFLYIQPIIAIIGAAITITVMLISTLQP